MKLKSYQELEVWKKAITWVESIYSSSRAFPVDERYGLTSQLRRAAVSVPSNIAEGAARTGTTEFLHYLSVANGSLAEAETLLLLALRLGFLESRYFETLIEQAGEIGRMMNGLRNSLQAK